MPEFDVSGVTAGYTRAEMVISSVFTDVELIDLDAVHFVSLNRHVRSPFSTERGSLSSLRQECVEQSTTTRNTP